MADPVQTSIVGPGDTVTPSPEIPPMEITGAPEPAGAAPPLQPSGADDAVQNYLNLRAARIDDLARDQLATLTPAQRQSAQDVQAQASINAGESVQRLEAATTTAQQVQHAAAIGGPTAMLMSMGFPMPQAMIGGTILDRASSIGGDAAVAAAEHIFGKDHPLVKVLADTLGAGVVGAAFGGVAARASTVGLPAAEAAGGEEAAGGAEAAGGEAEPKMLGGLAAHERELVSNLEDTRDRLSAMAHSLAPGTAEAAEPPPSFPVQQYLNLRAMGRNDLALRQLSVMTPAQRVEAQNVQARTAAAAGQRVAGLETATKIAEPIAQGLALTGNALLLSQMGLPPMDSMIGGVLLDKAQQLGGAGTVELAHKLGLSGPVTDAIANIVGGMVTGGLMAGPLGGAAAAARPQAGATLPGFKAAPPAAPGAEPEAVPAAGTIQPSPEIPPMQISKPEEQAPVELPESAAEAPAAPPAAGAEAKPAAVPPEQTSPVQGAIKTDNVPVKDIKTAPELFQYKTGYGQGGAGLALGDIQKWDPISGGRMILWRSPEGELYVVNGHQRLAAANRLGVDKVDAWVLDSKDFSPAQARAIGALTNIREGRGTALDAATFMRETDTTPAQMAAQGVSMGEGKTQDAVALSKLADPLFRAARNGEISEGIATTIGRELPDNQPGQQAIYDTVKSLSTGGREISQAKLTEMIRLAQGSANVVAEAGEAGQADLFGKRMIEQSLVPQQADILSYVRSRFGSDRRLFGTAAGQAERLEAGGTTVNVEQAQQIAESAARRIANLDASIYAKGTQSNALLQTAARELKDNPRGRNAILSNTYDALFDELNKPLGEFAPAATATAPINLGATAEMPPATPADIMARFRAEHPEAPGAQQQLQLGRGIAPAGKPFELPSGAEVPPGGNGGPPGGGGAPVQLMDAISSGDIPHNMQLMSAVAKSSLPTPEYIKQLRATLTTDDNHALIGQPIDAMDALRVHYYAADQVDHFMRAYQAGKAGDVDAMAQASAIERDLAENTMPVWRAMRHQMGLGLRVLGTPASGDTPLLQHVDDVLRSDSSGEAQTLRTLGSLPSAATREKYLQRAGEGGAVNLLRNATAYYVESLLSTITVAKKAATDAFLLMESPFERFVGEKAVAPLRRLAGANPAGTIAPGETEAAMQARIDAFGDAVHVGWIGLKTGESALASETGYGEVLPPRRLSVAGTMFQDTQLGRAIDLYFQFNHLAPRMMIGANDFSEMIHYREQLGALAYRQAYWDAAGSDNPATFNTAYAAYRQNPTPAMLEQAQEYARRQMLGTPMDSGGPWGAFLQGVQDLRARSSLGRIILPFFQTPVNLFRLTQSFGGPLAMMSRAWWNQVRSGTGDADMALARLAMGGVFSGWLVKRYMAGDIEGAPAPQKEVGKLETAEGKQAYSFKVLGHDLGFIPEPIAGLMKTIVDGGDLMGHVADKDAEAIGASLALMTGRYLADNTFWKGINGMIGMVSGVKQQSVKEASRAQTAAGMNPEAYQAFTDLQNKGGEPGAPGEVRNAIRQYAGSVVPSNLANVARALDPVHRQVDGMIAAIRDRTPGLKASGHPEVDLFGHDVEDVKGFNRWYDNLVGLFKLTKVTDDPVVDMLRRSGVAIPAMGNDGTLAVGGRGAVEKVQATPAQIYAAGKLRGTFVDPPSGLNLHGALDQLRRDPEFAHAGPDQQATAVSRIVAGYTRAAGAILVSRQIRGVDNPKFDPDLYNKFQTARQERKAVATSNLGAPAAAATATPEEF